MVQDQKLWDASQAFNILDHLRENKGSVFHVCGRYHVQYFLGAVEQLQHYLNDSESPFASFEFGERDEFRVIVCLPLDFEKLGDESELDTLASDSEFMHAGDFVIFTNMREPASEYPEGQEEAEEDVK